MNTRNTAIHTNLTSRNFYNFMKKQVFFNGNLFMPSEWKNGMLECWNIGGKGGKNHFNCKKLLQTHHFYPVKLFFYFTGATTPSFHYSIIPIRAKPLSSIFEELSTMNGTFYTLQEFMTYTEGVTYILIVAILLGMLGFWIFLVERDEN